MFVCFNAQEAPPLETRMKGKDLETFIFISPQFPYSAVADRVDVISEEYQMVHLQKYDQICPLILLLFFFFLKFTLISMSQNESQLCYASAVMSSLSYFNLDRW